MFANQLGQTLLVDSNVPFSDIESAMASLGWTKENDSGSGAPLITGEPEFATWTINGMKPFVIYTYNPVVSMRVLDVATVPPALRAKIAQNLPLLDERKVSQLLESKDVKQRLLALWAAQETERVDLLGKVESLKQDGEAIIAEQARDIAKRLASMNEARTTMLTQLKILSETAPKLIAQLDKTSFVQGLKPTREDLAKLFDEYLVEQLVTSVDVMYQQQPHIYTLEANAQIEVFATPAGLLRWSNMLSNKFPGGYRDIAGWMNPHRIWLAWTITTPQGGGTRYDGLVWLEDKWLWLPKIFRYLMPYLMTGPTQTTSQH